MPSVYLKTKIQERASQTQVLQNLQDQAAKAGRDLTEAERATFEEITKRLGFLDDEIARVSEADAGAAKFMELVGASREAEERADRAHEKATERRDVKSDEPVERRADFGRSFVESTAFTEYRGTGTSQRLTLPGPASPEFRAAITMADFTPAPSQWWPGPVGPMAKSPLLDALGRVQTSQAAVLYLTWSHAPATNLAQKVAEGAMKPESPIDPLTATAALETYAHYKAITRQALEDIPQIQTIVSNKLLAGVLRALENAAGAALVAATLPTATGTDTLSAIRVGIATAEAAGYTPNAIVVNPADAAGLDLAAMGASFTGPVRSGSAWGLPVVASNAVAVGTSFVGDFNQGVTWFDRGTTDVYLSDSHADYFIRNMFVILAEARAAFAVTEPGAVVEVTVTP